MSPRARAESPLGPARTQCRPEEISIPRALYAEAVDLRSQGRGLGETLLLLRRRCAARPRERLLRTLRLRSLPLHAAPLTPGATGYYLEAEEGPVSVKSSISLTDEQHAFARALVEAGRYPSLSAVLQQGVDLLRRRMDAEELETAALRELLSRRREGAFVDTEVMDARLAAMVADKHRAHGLRS